MKDRSIASRIVVGVAAVLLVVCLGIMDQGGAALAHQKKKKSSNVRNGYLSVLSPVPTGKASTVYAFVRNTTQQDLVINLESSQPSWAKPDTMTLTVPVGKNVSNKGTVTTYSAGDGKTVIIKGYYLIAGKKVYLKNPARLVIGRPKKSGAQILIGSVSVQNPWPINQCAPAELNFTGSVRNMYISHTAGGCCQAPPGLVTATSSPTSFSLFIQNTTPCTVGATENANGSGDFMSSATASGFIIPDF